MNEHTPLAGRGRRLAAAAIDLLLVPALAVVLMLVTGVLEHAEDYAGSKPLIRSVLLGLSSYLLLNGLLLWRRGQTIGKALLGIAIVKAADRSVVPLWKLLFVRGLFFPTPYLTILGPLALSPCGRSRIDIQQRAPVSARSIERHNRCEGALASCPHWNSCARRHTTTRGPIIAC
ncbi:MAG: RDD family protein [Gammaproteobacteria bacterium]|nr:RDD family protein [Gammaproteobacteria bacterium]